MSFFIADLLAGSSRFAPILHPSGLLRERRLAGCESAVSEKTEGKTMKHRIIHLLGVPGEWDRTPEGRQLAQEILSHNHRILFGREGQERGQADLPVYCDRALPTSSN